VLMTPSIFFLLGFVCPGQRISADALLVTIDQPISAPEPRECEQLTVLPACWCW
jgi:hypothetical protein